MDAVAQCLAGASFQGVLLALGLRVLDLGLGCLCHAVVAYREHCITFGHAIPARVFGACFALLGNPLQIFQSFLDQTFLYCLAFWCFLR